ncbi:MAG: DUF945 family protein [Cellvibrio sp.]|nr:DUF945 family protein [Cellvibrio sp.]
MKKILGALAGVVLVYVGICFSLGFVAENSINERIELHNQHAGQLNGVKLELKKFSRGILGSEMDINIRFTGTDAVLNLFTFSSHSKIQHGPLLLLNGFSIGAYATESTFVITTPDDEVNKKINDIFGDSIGLVKANVSFTKTYSGNWTLNPIDIENDGAQFKVDKTLISFAGDFKNPQASNMTGEFNIGAISIKDATTDVAIDPLTGKMDQTLVDSVPVGNMNLATKKISIQNSMGFPIALENLSIEQKQIVTDKKLNTLVAMRLDKFTGPIEVNNSFYQVEFNNIPLEGLKKILELMNNPDAQVSPEQQMAALLPALSNIMVDGIQFKLGLGSELMEGKLTGDFNLLYRAPTDGKTIVELESPEQMLALFSAELNVSVSESIVSQTPMGGQLQPLVGTYVTLENGVYHLTANLKDTAITVGTQTIPAEQYLPLLMMGMMGMNAGGDAPAEDSDIMQEEMNGEEAAQETYEEPEETATE